MQPSRPAKPVEIVLTGGPSSGKSSATRYLVEHLTSRGWRVLVVPEVATMLISGGLGDIGNLAGNDRERFLDVQVRLTQMQWGLRQHYLDLARDLAHDSAGAGGLGAQGKVVLIHDRAVLDNAAYTSGEEFYAVVADALDLHPAQVSAHYDAVLHLVTAADGAVEHYTLDTNEARTETPEQAIELDRAVRDSWLGHAHFTVIDNPVTGGFDAKLVKVLAAVLNVLGEPTPVENERKWLLSSPPSQEFLDTTVPIEIEQSYLRPEGDVERRVRARSHDGHVTYFHTTKAPTETAEGRIEHEERIGAEAYRLLNALRDPETRPIRKRRHCFAWGGQHFELDHITEPVDAWLLEAELVLAGEQVTLPDFLDVDREVTEDPVWRNGSIARNATRLIPGTGAVGYEAAVSARAAQLNSNESDYESVWSE